MRRKGQGKVGEQDTSGKTGNKGSPYSSRVITGLPLRVSSQPAAQPSPQPSPRAPAAANSKDMAGQNEVFGKVSNIVLVMGASVSGK